MPATYAKIMERVREIVKSTTVPYRPDVRFREVPSGVDIDTFPGPGRRIFEVLALSVREQMEFVGPRFAMNQMLELVVCYWFDQDHASREVAKEMAGTDGGYLISSILYPSPERNFHGMCSQILFDVSDLKERDDRFELSMRFLVGYELEGCHAYRS